MIVWSNCAATLYHFTVMLQKSYSNLGLPWTCKVCIANSVRDASAAPLYYIGRVVLVARPNRAWVAYAIAATRAKALLVWAYRSPTNLYISITASSTLLLAPHLPRMVRDHGLYWHPSSPLQKGPDLSMCLVQPIFIISAFSPASVLLPLFQSGQRAVAF